MCVKSLADDTAVHKRGRILKAHNMIYASLYNPYMPRFLFCRVLSTCQMERMSDKSLFRGKRK